MQRPTATTKMLASGRLRNAPATRQPGPARRSVAATSASGMPKSYLPGDRVLVLARAPVVAGLRGQVRPHVLLRHEQQTGVRVRRSDEAAGQLVEEQLHDGVEALQVGLLVDGELQRAVLDQP